MLIDQTQCDACKLLLHPSHPEHRPSKGGGGIILLDSNGGGWALNHYAGSGVYLGWMALLTVGHKEQISDLDSRELMSLGTHLQRVDQYLRDYWEQVFHDPIEQMYAICFMEGLHDQISGEPTPSPWHLHFHLIPRFKSMDQLMREHQLTGSSGINAWNIYKAAKRADFPVEYIPKEETIRGLMVYLAGRFGALLHLG
uniref:HIT domain-containing protein n=1 Tax=viral metagenome TaxID=1070528 RepID=A0A6M3LNV8_9ZZZZ